jgi:hypothetical protein
MTVEVEGVAEARAGNGLDEGIRRHRRVR